MSLERKYELEITEGVIDGDKIKLNAKEVSNLLDDVLTRGDWGDMGDVEDVMESFNYYHEDDVFDRMSTRQLEREIESMGYIHENDVNFEMFLPGLNKTKQAIVDWKIESVLENINKFTQEEFEHWLLTKDTKDEQLAELEETIVDLENTLYEQSEEIADLKRTIEELEE
jgi:hypothetical protein